MTDPLILAVNPGSTSTKIAVYAGEKKRLGRNIFHTAKELSPFKKVADQHAFRKKVILDFLEQNSIDIMKLSAVVGRGGMLTPMESGTYLVTKEMVEYLKTNPIEHASNLGAILASEIAGQIGKRAYIVDPIVVDEMDDVARVTGMPEIERQSIFHALNQKAAAREGAKVLEKSYEESNLIVVHLGGGISVGAHRKGRVIDVNNALNGDGPMGPERAGSIPTWSLIELVDSRKYDRSTLKKMVTGKGGLVAHLDTNDVRVVKERIENGDRRSERVYHAMAYQVAKEVGAMAAALAGNIDAVVFTGGIAHDKEFVGLIRSRISFLAPIIHLPGEDEMFSLAKGALRILSGEETEKIWQAR
jgi:butyrate kinase